MRFKIVQVLYLMILIVVLARLFYWQIIKYDELIAKAEGQHLKVNKITSPRGIIYSSDGSVLVSNKPSYLFYGLPKVVKDKNQLASDVSSILKSENYERKKFKDELVEKLSQDLFWTILVQNVDIVEKIKLEKLNLEGVGFQSDLSRYYPEGSSSAHILGFVGQDPQGKPTGYFGLEGYYNGELKGVEGQLTEERDAMGLPILIGKFFAKAPIKGHDLILHIDRTIQFIAEQNLKEGIAKYGAKAGLVVVMDPRTGGILAMASFPNYDPASYPSYPREYYKNPIVADSYEPGSTFKAFVMAAAINEKLVKPETACEDCDGPVQIGGFLIRTWNNKYYPETTMVDTLVHSDNTGMVFVGKKLGIDKLFNYIEKFGFGNLTKIDLQDESSPDIRDRDEWKDVDLATASFGQGIAVTPIQMVKGLAAIANGGLLLEPHMVKQIKTHDKVIEIKPKVENSPITHESAKIITEMLVQAVDRGEARVFKPKGFKIAGKTGTAQIPLQGHYDLNKTIASFVGFAPADDPKFVMLVLYDQPTASVYGSETAAPTFFAIAKELFTHYNIAPEE